MIVILQAEWLLNMDEHECDMVNERSNSAGPLNIMKHPETSLNHTITITDSEALCCQHQGQRGKTERGEQSLGRR